MRAIPILAEPDHHPHPVKQPQEAVELLLAGDLPSAIFCGNDMLAFGAYRGLSRSGIRVPEDVVLIGYDDIDFAASAIVPLTSIRQPSFDMGREAASLLLAALAGGDEPLQSVRFEPRLVERQTTNRT